MRLFALLSVSILLVSASPAVAHQLLTGSTPAEAAVLNAPPSRLVLRFGVPVSVLVLRLISPGNVITDLGHATPDADGLIVPAPADLGRGTHLLRWRVVGSDGHPTSGVLTFSVGEAGETPAVPLDRAQGLDTAVWAARLLLHLGLFVGVGGALFRAWLAASAPLPRFASRCISIALVTTVAVVPALAGLQGLDALEGSWMALATAETWHAGSTTTYTYTMALAAFAAALALAANHTRNPAWARLLSLLALAAAGAAIAASGHAATASTAWAARPALFVHAASLIFWIGALVPLAALLATAGPQRMLALRRFSATIPVPLAALILSGIVLSGVQLRPLISLLTTSYGLVLLLKLGLVFVLLAFAAYNRLVLTPRFLANKDRTGRVFASSISVELMLVLAILGVVGLWRFTPPPRVLEHMARPLLAQMEGQDVTALVTLTRGRDAPRSMSITLLDRNSRPLEADELRVLVVHSSGSVEPIRRAATRSGRGKWQVDGLFLPLLGPWMIHLNAQFDDLESVQLEQRIEVSG